MSIPKFTAEAALGKSKRVYINTNALWGAATSTQANMGSLVLPSQEEGMEDGDVSESADSDESEGEESEGEETA
jgi:hypothetical protein